MDQAAYEAHLLDGLGASFQGSWNDFSDILIAHENPALDTLTTGVGRLVSGQLGAATQYPLKLAAAVAMTVPVAIVFFVFQKYILIDEVVLLVSELCTNAVLHTTSGDGGNFEVVIYPSSSSVRIIVRDNGSSRVPELSVGDALSEDGRGLALVELIADHWGYDGDHQGRAVSF